MKRSTKNDQKPLPFLFEIFVQKSGKWQKWCEHHGFLIKVTKFEMRDKAAFCELSVGKTETMQETIDFVSNNNIGISHGPSGIWLAIQNDIIWTILNFPNCSMLYLDCQGTSF